MFRGFWGILTLATGGLIIANLATHPTALYVGLGGLDSILRTGTSGLLGQTNASPFPSYPKSK